MSAFSKWNSRVVAAEQLSSEVESLLDLARQRGTEARSVKTDTPTQRIFTTSPQPAEISELLSQDLRDVLEAELVPAIDEDSASGIFDREVDREIQKKALVGLRLHTLKRLAGQLGLDKRGRVDDLADRIARAFRYDEEAIAQLIADNADEPQPERRYSSRIFPTAEVPALAAIKQRVEWAMGRYIRVGVAQWIEFGAIDDDEPNTLVLQATMQAYRAYLTSNDDSPALTSTPSSTPVAITVKADRATISVEGANASVARAAIRALIAVSDVRLRDGIPDFTEVHSGTLGTFDRETIFMLDLIYNRVPWAGGRRINLTAAKFRMSREDKATAGDSEEDRPSLKSVRFEGMHLLDSATACKLIAQEGRALVDVSMTVGQLMGSDDEEVRFPVRFSLERNHVSVFTGYGRIPAVAAGLQTALVQAAEREIEDGTFNRDRLQELADRIAEFSRTDAAPDHATMLKQQTEEPA